MSSFSMADPPRHAGRRGRLRRGGRFLRRAGGLGKGLLAVVAGVFAVRAADSAPPALAGQPVTPQGDAVAAPGFTEFRGPALGLTFTNNLSRAALVANVNLANGSGVAAGDFDGDGWCDLYFCAVDGRNALFRNLGQWRFADVTAASGLTQPHPHCTGAVFADLNGDGALDLLVSSLGGGVHCFLNDGRGHFRDTTRAAGLASRQGSTTMTLGDVDGDGDLDLYVANYGAVSYVRSAMRVTVKQVNGRWVFPGVLGQRLRFVNGRIEEVGEPDVLFLNDGEGRFLALPWTARNFVDEEGRPKAAPADYGLTAQMRDINQDGLPDLYVCNDFQTPDRLWLNEHHERFRLIPRLAIRHESFSSMSVDFADVDRDGFLDFFVTEMWSQEHRDRLRQLTGMRPLFPRPGYFRNRPDVVRNTLFWNRGDGTYAEIAAYSGVAASDWSWSQAFLDVDLDGYEDLLVANGMIVDVQDRDTKTFLRRLGPQSVADSRTNILAHPPFLTPNVAWRNQGDLTFADRGRAWGFAATNISPGLALADLDNDGDQDVILNTLQGSPLLYRNNATTPRVAVRLRGPRGNIQGIGAKVRLRGGPVPAQTQEIVSGGRYLGGDDPLRVFAAAPAAGPLTLEVEWPDGRQSRFERVQPNRIYTVDYATARPAPPKPRPAPAPPWFADVSDWLSHTHHEEVFDDYARQPLLPFQRSGWGPGLTWCDLDQDGWPDLLIGSGRGGRLAAFHNQAGTAFVPIEAPPFDQTAPRDQTAILPLPRPGGAPRLLVGSANYEDGRADGAVARTCDPSAGRITETLPGQLASTGPLALADYDGDGDLDLFVGGQVLPGRYPEPADSLLFRRDGGRWVADAENTALLRRIGLVNGAVWSDLTGDGFPELALACEWGPIRLFHNERGRLRSWNPPLTGAATPRFAPPATLDQLTGWWTGVTSGDFNGDGRLDLVAGNWGENTGYHATPAHPLRLYYGDVLGSGTMDLIETEWAPELNAWAPLRSLAALSRAFPLLAEAFPTHRGFAETPIEQLLAALPGPTRRVTARTLDSVLLLNEGDRFRVIPLPREAQFAPVFGVCVADADGDGAEDVFLSQNFLAVRPEWPRMDAGRGLWLRGDGRGNFTPVRGQRSGVKIYGEGRGAAVADFDRDGRVDLAVGQNGAATRLYRNQVARPGPRLRLNAGPGNPRGIGAVVRLRFGDQWGPARELHAGAGWWSVDEPVPVLGAPSRPVEVEVRWPGGLARRYPVPAGAAELSLAPGAASLAAP